MRDLKRLTRENDVEGLVDLLTHSKKGVRAEAASALGLLANESGVAQLIVTLGEETEPSVREAIATALRPFDSPAVVAALAARVEGDTSDTVRSVAALSLIGKQKSRGVCDALIAVMLDASVKCRVRRDTALALGVPSEASATAAIEQVLLSKKGYREAVCWSSLAVAPTLALWDDQYQEWRRLFEANMTDADEILFTMNLGGTIGGVALTDRWIIGWHRNTLKGVKDPTLVGWVVRYDKVGPVAYSLKTTSHYFIDFGATGPGTPLRFTDGQGITDLDQAAPFLDWLNRRNEAIQHN